MFKFLIIFPAMMYNSPDKYDYDKIEKELDKY